ncbi:MAG: hypothetical protein HKP40_09170, partial [Litoreibacter sp.]|nr:hypothetical protein [Litoreibacter sp.]
MLTFSSNTPAHDPPAWFDEFSSSLHYASHLILSGNIRDFFPTWDDEVTSFVNLDHVLETLLKKHGIGTVLRHDPVGGLTVSGEDVGEISDRLTEVDIPLGSADLRLSQLASAFRALEDGAGKPAALVVDYASHLAAATDAERDAFFVQIDRQTRRQVDSGRRLVTIWL